jgi:predicted glycosyltransferase
MPHREMRLLFYCQDAAGLGHLRRAVTLAAHLGRVFPQAEALFVTRNAVTLGLFHLPPRSDVVKLPSLAPVGPDAQGEIRALPDREDARYQRLRATLIREVVREFQPHLIHVDNEPLGVQGELQPALTYVQQASPRTAVVFGLRDIRGTAAHVRQKWQNMGIYGALERFYQRIVVYGERTLYDVADHYALTPAIATRLTYCGYVVQPGAPPDDASVRRELGLPLDLPVVAVTVGSGTDGYTLLRAYLAALPHLLKQVPVHSVIVTGPLMAPEQRDLMQASRARGLPLTLRTSCDTRALMAVAQVVICRGGYNSVGEALSLGHHPLVIPRETQSGEQALRAQIFQSHGWCTTLREHDLCAERIVQHVVTRIGPGRGTVPRSFVPEQALVRVEAALRPLLEANHA